MKRDMPQLTELDKLQRLDHDTIVRLEVKLDKLISDVKTLNDGNTKTIADHETRLKKVEDDILSIGGVKEAWGRFLAIEKFIQDTRVSANAYRIAAGALGGAILWILLQVPTAIQFFWTNAFFNKL